MAGLLVAALGVPARAGSAEPADRVEAIVASALAEFRVPGAAVVIAAPEGRWTRVFGLADVESGRKVSRRDYFAIRSVTKSFVVTAVLQLVAAGTVDLDLPIGTYVAGVPNGDVITVRQLASMTSGLFDYTSDGEFRQQFGNDPTRAWTTNELLALAFRRGVNRPIVFPPGTRYQYSNTNTLLLGKLVEAVTKRPFANVLATAILRPAGLRSTRYLTGVLLPSPSATGYQGFVDGEPDAVAINATSLGFAGAMAATVDDLARWGAALAEGSLLPPALQEQRFRARATAGDPHSPLYDRYGLGIGEVAGWWGHTGEGVGFEAAVFHQITQDRTFAIMLNASNVSDVPVKIFCRLLRAFDEAPERGSICSAEPGGRGQPRDAAAAITAR